MEFKSKQWECLKKTWHLTPREIEVAKMVCNGLNNEQICRKLHIKYNTVRAHLGNIYRKAGARGKAAIILEFIRTLNVAGI